MVGPPLREIDSLMEGKPVTDAEALKETLGLPLMENDSLRDSESVIGAEAPTDRLGLPLTGLDPLKDGKPMIDAETPTEGVALSFTEAAATTEPERLPYNDMDADKQATSVQPYARFDSEDDSKVPVTDAEAPKETVGLPLRDADPLAEGILIDDTLMDGKLTDGRESEMEAVVCNGMLGVSFRESEALKHIRSVQPYANVDKEGEAVTEAEILAEFVGLP